MSDTDDQTRREQEQEAIRRLRQPRTAVSPLTDVVTPADVGDVLVAGLVEDPWTGELSVAIETQRQWNPERVAFLGLSLGLPLGAAPLVEGLWPRLIVAASVFTAVVVVFRWTKARHFVATACRFFIGR